MRTWQIHRKKLQQKIRHLRKQQKNLLRMKVLLKVTRLKSQQIRRMNLQMKNRMKVTLLKRKPMMQLMMHLLMMKMMKKMKKADLQNLINSPKLRFRQMPQNLSHSQLNDLAERFGTPLYVYHTEKIKEQYQKLTSGFSVIDTRFFFACKALTNINILKYINSLGCGIDCSSVTEVKLASVSYTHLRAHET